MHLVVIYHASGLVFAGGPGTPASQFWVGAWDWTPAFRVPAFFLVSGLLAHRAIWVSWRQSRGRTLGLLYVAAVWMALSAVTATALGTAPAGADPEVWLLRFRQGYWYLFALVGMFALARLTRSWPASLVVLLCSLPALVGQPVIDLVADGRDVPVIGLVLGLGGDAAGLLSLAFFMAGVRCRDLITQWAGRASVRAAGALTVAATIADVLWLRLGEPVGAMRGLVSALLVGAMVAWASSGARVPALARLGDRLGGRTVAVFVLQFPLLILGTALMTAWSAGGVPGWVLWSCPVLFTLLNGAMAHGLARLTDHRGWRLLLYPPRWAASQARPRPGSRHVRPVTPAEVASVRSGAPAEPTVALPHPAAAQAPRG